MSTVCRVCLVGNIKMYSIENNYILETYEKLTNSKASSLLGPLSLCYICHSLLQKCYKLGEVARTSENILKDLFDQGIEATYENIHTLNPSIKNNLSTSCVQLNSFTDKDENIKVTVKVEPITEEQTENNKRLVVDLANLIFVKKDFTSGHNDTSNVEENSIRQSNDTAEHIKKDFTMEHVKEFNPRHIKTEIEIPIQDNPEPIHEFTTVHIKEEPTHSESDETFQSNQEIVPDKVNRNKVNKLNSFNEKLERHNCTECGRGFMTKRSFITHMQNHDKLNLFACNLCDKKFFWNAELVRHLRTHTGEKPFPCNICGKKFTQKGHLVAHKRMHSGEKPFACDVCNVKFAFKNGIKSHMKTHTGEKYTCEICYKKFTRNHSLKIHLRIHTGEKPLSCHLCGKKYSQRGSLRAHLKIHKKISETVTPDKVLEKLSSSN